MNKNDPGAVGCGCGIFLVVAMFLGIGQCNSKPDIRQDSLQPLAGDLPSSDSKSIITPQPPASRANDESENLASEVKVVSAALDQERSDNFVDSVTGTFLHIHWKNKSKKPIREVWAEITVLNVNGDPIPGYDHTKWCLYYESEAVPPGSTQWDHENVSGWPQLDEPAPSRATVKILSATEGQSDPASKAPVNE